MLDLLEVTDWAGDWAVVDWAATAVEEAAVDLVAAGSATVEEAAVDSVMLYVKPEAVRVVAQVSPTTLSINC